MLQEYIEAYIEAKIRNDTKEINRIIKELNILGMDKYTLEIITSERIRERKL